LQSFSESASKDKKNNLIAIQSHLVQST